MVIRRLLGFVDLIIDRLTSEVDAIYNSYSTKKICIWLKQDLGWV